MVGTDHKFNNTIPVSYEELVKDPVQEKLQLAKEFEARLGKEAVLDIIKEMSIRSAMSRARSRADAAGINGLREFARHIEKMHDNEATRNTQTFETIEVSDERYHFKVRECLWAKAYRDLNEPEYGDAFECCTDFPVCQAYHRSLRLTRDKALMMGDDCCEFVYTWANEQLQE